MRLEFTEILNAVMNQTLVWEGNFSITANTAQETNQQQTNEAFSDKWKVYGDNEDDDQEKLFAFQRKWYLDLYGFGSEEELAVYLQSRNVIFDAGCGLGYKAAWFAELAPESLVVGMDYSGAAQQAALKYETQPNLFFLQGDIAQTPFNTGAVDFVSCDQVIMHTENPEDTFAELARITSKEKGEFACYFYAKKALPRELIDDHFRVLCKEIPQEQLWELSEQLTELGKTLSELDVKFEAPEIPLLGIKGGEIDIQRFIYWNFLKCFWNPALGNATSLATNYDWYSPSNARRFDTDEIRHIAGQNNMKYVFEHSEAACHSGRFVHK